MMTHKTNYAARRKDTIRQALTRAAQTLTGSDAPALDARVLLAFVLQAEPAHLFAHGDETLTDDSRRQYSTLVTRRAEGEPIAYITGRRGFYDLELAVNPSVLIPRPETELLLEEALRLMADQSDCIVADIGTGSGALAVTFARHKPTSQVYGLDISEDALVAAQENADRHGAAVQFLSGHLGQPLIKRGIKPDLLMANLPYIPTKTLARLAVGRYEPRLALDGGADGLDCIRALLAQIPQLCQPGAYVLLEIGADQGAAVTALARDRLGAACDILPDYAGLDRIARFQVGALC